MVDNNINYFSVYEISTPTNENVEVIFTPNRNIESYEYQIINNGKIIQNIVISNNEPSKILLTETGNHVIKVKMYPKKGEVLEVSSGIYQIDKDLPVISLLNQKPIELTSGDSFDALSIVSTHDVNSSGEKIDLKDKIITNINELDLKSVGAKKLIYSVSDDAGNTTTKSLVITVVPDNSTQLTIIHIGIGIIFISFLILLLFFNKSMRLVKRISPYGINPIDDNTVSLFDNIMFRFKTFISKITVYLEKSVFISKYAKRYDKYVGVINKVYDKGVNFVASKFVISLLFLLVAIFSRAIQQEVLALYEMLVPLLVGFFIPDLLYIYRYRLYRQKLENDLLQAITIMNNAFKSGRSIMQAISLVTTELEGPIAEEFKKMHLELSLGLGIDVVFKRFADRVELDEVNYLTASLSILNKTGGNIIKVFSSIEKTMFDKKRLNLELKALTGVSRIIVYVLITMPILFVVFINFVNPDYFAAFYNSPIGIVIMFIILLIYTLYIIIVMKTMKVRMWSYE